MAAEPLSAVEARLAEIEARAEKATEGPWEIAWNTPEAKKIGAYVYTKHLGAICACPRESPQFSVHLQHMEFIAHARTDIPYLLSLIRASSAREQAMREALEEIDRIVADHSERGHRGEYRMTTIEDIRNVARAALQETK